MLKLSWQITSTFAIQSVLGELKGLVILTSNKKIYDKYLNDWKRITFWDCYQEYYKKNLILSKNCTQRENQNNFFTTTLLNLQKRL